MEDTNNVHNFEIIVRDNYKQVFRTAIGFVHSQEDAEDITQDVFVRAYKAYDKFRGQSSVSTWLYRITVNVSLGFLDKKKRCRLINSSLQVLGFEYKQNSPQQELENTEQDTVIRKAIDTLPKKQKIAFILSRYDDLPQKEIAAIMSISVGAVEQLLQRAKTHLQKKIVGIL